MFRRSIPLSHHLFLVCISTRYKEMSMSFRSTPPMLSLSSLTMSGYATLQWSVFLESHILLVQLAFTVENVELRITFTIIPFYDMQR